MTLLSTRRRRALVVNCYADETRRPVARTHKVPQAMAPAFLAGGLNPALWDVRLYNEMTDGPLQDERALGWPDLLVLTGLISSVDRMRHLTAYARTRNPGVVVVGGGHVIRALPKYCSTFLDHACLGDVEEIREVVSDVYGAEYAADEMTPRFDLVDWMDRIGYVESSRYCNFKCSFCTLTAEGRKYDPTGPEELRRQIRAVGKRRHLIFLDNNIYGSDRRSFAERMKCVAELRDTGQFNGWGALATNDFFFKKENLDLARESGCIGMFTGVESFDTEWTEKHNKMQNSVRPQLEIIRDSLEAGIVFLYGLMLDLTTRSVADIKKELDVIVENPDITLPAYVSLPIPIPRTPFFYECLDKGLILPSTKFRDLDSTTISLRPQDSMEEAVQFVDDLQSMRGWRWRIIRHTIGFARRHRKRLTMDQMIIALSNGAMIAAPLWATLPKRVGRRTAPRTYVSTTEPLDGFYAPAFAVDARFEGYFQPTMLTDAGGEISAQIQEDIAGGRAGASPIVPFTVPAEPAAG